MSFNRKSIKFFGGIFRNSEAMFVLIFAWTSHGFKSSRHTSAQAAHGQFTLGSHLNEIPAHFNHEMRTIAYDVIGVNVFLLTLMRFLLKKEE